MWCHLVNKTLTDTTPNQQHPPPSGWLTLLVFLATLLCYLATLTQVHTFDALSYVLDVDRKSWQELFHPHHLAYGPLGALVRSLTHLAGYQQSVLLPLQIVNAFAGAAGVTLLFALLHHQTHRRDIALCGALLLGSSYAYWYYAIEVEVYTIAALLLIACLWIMISMLRSTTWHRFLLLGATQALAILFHQTNALLTIPALLTLLLTFRNKGNPPLTHIGKCLTAYLLPLTLITAGSYLLVGFGISDHRSWSEFWQWLTAYAHTGWWGEPISNTTWQNLGKGLTNTLAQPGGALLWFLLLGLIVLQLHRLLQTYAQTILILLAWIITYGAFFTWWEPDNIEFWIASMPPVVVLIGLTLHTTGPRWNAAVWVALAIGITAASTNYEAIQQRGMLAYDTHRRITTALARHSALDDLLLVSDQVQALYLPYYESRPHAWSLNQAMFENHNNWNAACNHLHTIIESAQERGAAVIFAAEVLRPTPQRTPWSDPILQRFNLAQEEITRCFARYQTYLEPLPLKNGLPAHYRLPSALEIGTGPGWHFADGTWGWQVRNIHHHQHTEQGWEILPAVDPAFISPPMTIDTTHYHAIEIHMAASAATTATAKLELFFRDEHGLVDMTNAVERTLERADAPAYHEKTYGITLEGREGWSGRMSGFRLDPIGEGDGGHVRLEWIRLIPKGEVAEE